MSKSILILGMGGTGTELYDLLSEEYKDVAYLDDFKEDENIHDKLANALQYKETHEFLSGLGSYKTMTFRKRTLEEIPTSAFSKFHHGLAYKSARVDKTCITFPTSVISSNAALSKHTFVYHNCTIAHDVTINAFSMISNNACVSGGVTIGENTYVGANSTILEGIKVGKNCIIAAGSTVTRDVPDNMIYISTSKLKANEYI